MKCVRVEWDAEIESRGGHRRVVLTAVMMRVQLIMVFTLLPRSWNNSTLQERQRRSVT